MATLRRRPSPNGHAHRLIRIESTSRELTGRSRSDLESIVLERLIDLADPELSLATTSGADLRLVNGGSLCFPAGMGGYPVLHASAGGNGVALRLVLSKLSGDWTIVA